MLTITPRIAPLNRLTDVVSSDLKWRKERGVRESAGKLACRLGSMNTGMLRSFSKIRQFTSDKYARNPKNFELPALSQCSAFHSLREGKLLLQVVS